MLSAIEAAKTVDAEKRQRIIERYLSVRFKEQFDAAWLDTMDNYADLETAINFFDELDNDNLKMSAIGSSNGATFSDHQEQFQLLKRILDHVVVFTDHIPPVTTRFDEKRAFLIGLELNQALESSSLRDLHAQSDNLGIVEKLLNSELGQTEWLGEIDLERMLIKLGIKDRTHITRLNDEDIGLILHFEREKHIGEIAPYTVPLLINCGSSGSLRSQGVHWTYALVAVDPGKSTITIGYQDSMPLTGNERTLLQRAINYKAGRYSAFPGYITKIDVATDGLQEDCWSCGYRALKGLITDPGFPVHEHVAQSVYWQRLTRAANDSFVLRDVVYDLLLENMDIDRQYAENMELEQAKVTLSIKENSYHLDKKFIQHYRELLAGTHETTGLIPSEHFATEYKQIRTLISTMEVVTSRERNFRNLTSKLEKIITNAGLSSDIKILAILDAMTSEYSQIINSFGGGISGLGYYIKSFCAEHMGVELGLTPLYRIKKDGLISRILDNQTGIDLDKRVEERLLPSIPKKTIETDSVSHSAPIVKSTKQVEPSVIRSEGSIGRSEVDNNQPVLRKNKTYSRIGAMFGVTQFCFGKKTGGVEPGFKAIDLNDAFFNELERILADEHLTTATNLSLNEQMKLIKLRDVLGNAEFKRKQVIFAAFINSHVSSSHHEHELINPGVQWLCNEIKEAVAKNNNLSAWMYKLDYAEGEKDRVKANKEAIREYVGTYLAGIFSEQNQRQELVWMRDSAGTEHALLACGWKNGLQELSDFLHNGVSPDYNGVLVDDPAARIKHSKYIPGLAKNLIFGIAIGDRDGIGKNAQNKGFADGAFYGFDYGKPYEGAGVSSSLHDDFSFVDRYAKAPALLRGNSTFGIARHYMYRNYNVFYDTDLSERMVGFHLFRKMITGENPDEEVIKSYPGLRQELYRIQETTPSLKALLKQLNHIRHHCDETKIQSLVDNHIMDVCTDKLSNFDLYFTKIKCDIIAMAVKTGMPYEELADYIKFINEMQVQAHRSNTHILNTFAQRMLLTRQEIDLLDHLEKFCSPTSIMSPDNEVFLNRLRIDPQSSRIPFQLKREQNGTYTLSTLNESIARTLKDQFHLFPVKSAQGVSCYLNQHELSQLMTHAEKKYNEKKEVQLFRPTYKVTTLKYVSTILNSHNKPTTSRVEFGIAWEDVGLAVRIVAKTTEQALQMHKVFGVPPKVNEVMLFTIPHKNLQIFQKKVDTIYELEGHVLQSTLGHQEIEFSSLPKKISVSSTSDTSKKWNEFHQKETKTPTFAEQLMNRFEVLVLKEDVLEQIRNAIAEASINDIKQLMQYNDKTLSHPENIEAIINERLGAIREISDELIAKVSASDSNDIQLSIQ